MRHLLLMAALLVGGCGVDGDSLLPPARAPALPIIESLHVDVSFFFSRSPEPGGTTTHWAWAREKAMVVDSSMGQAFSLPEAILQAVQGQTPRRRGDEWEWDYQAVHGSHTYSGFVRGWRNGAEDAWGIVISSSSSGLSDYVLAVGATALGVPTFGRWTIRNPFRNPLAWAGETTWVRDTLNPQNMFVSFARPGSVYYVRREDTVWDIRFVSAQDEDSFWMMWNPANGKGSISLPIGSGLCWDTNLQNSECLGFP